MSITFDDQQPLPGEHYREARKGFSLEQKMLQLGIAKNRQEAVIYSLVAGIAIMAVCIFTSYSLLKPDPIDTTRYYNPISGEPVYANE